MLFHADGHVAILHQAAHAESTEFHVLPEATGSDVDATERRRRFIRLYEHAGLDKPAIDQRQTHQV